MSGYRTNKHQIYFHRPKTPSKNTVEDRGIYNDTALRVIATRRRRKNHAVGVNGIRNLLRHVISSQSCMESSRIIIAQYALRAMPYATSLQLHTTRKRVDYMPSLREPPKLAHSLRGTPTAAWITKKELLVDKSSFFVGAGDRT